MTTFYDGVIALVDRWKSALAPAFDPKDWFGHRANALGKVVDYNMLREAIDTNPHLFSARISSDYHAIMVELNRHLPDGRMVGIFDVKRAMDLRPVPQPTNCVQAVGRATSRGAGLTGAKGNGKAKR